MNIKSEIIKIKKYLSSFQTKDVLGFISAILIPFGNSGKEVANSADILNKTSLMAPMKQFLYLAGLLVSTEYDINNSRHLNIKEKINIEEMLGTITNDYCMNFLKASLTKSTSNQSFDANYIISAFESFDAYFNTGNLSYPEQVIDKINLLFSKFDKEINKLFKLNLDDFLNFYSFIYDKQCESFNNMEEEISKVGEVLENDEFKDEEEIYNHLKNANFDKNNLLNSIDKLNCVSVDDLYERFGSKKAEMLCKYFRLEREERKFEYYTDENPFLKKPLVYVDDNFLFITFAPLLLDSIYNLLFEALKTNDNFIKSRGDAVEEKTIHLFSQLFPGAIFYKKVCEKTGNFEHDIVIDYKEYYFIVEVKASKLRMPLYNPEKSAIRVKDHFFSEVGIGYAYKQCIELKKRFDKKVNLALFIDKNKSFVFKPKNKIVPIIVTLENFGAIQINYSDLLIPESGQPYAWSINIPDLENIIEINKYLSKGPSSFIDYISFRLKHFKEIKASDELEILELFYKNKIKGLKKDTTYFIEPSGKSLIDKIYFEKKGVPYDYSIKEFNLK